MGEQALLGKEESPSPGPEPTGHAPSRHVSKSGLHYRSGLNLVPNEGFLRPKILSVFKVSPVLSLKGL